MIPTSFQLPRRDGTIETIEVPSRGTDHTTAMGMFGKACLLIGEEWHLRDKHGKRDHDWTKKVCYALIIAMTEQGFGELFRDRLVEFDRKPAGERVEQLFLRGIRAIFAHDLGIIELINPHRFADELWIAYRHYVPVEFLTGFLRTNSPKKRPSLINEGRIDPEMRAWVVIERARDDCPNLRGSYDDQLETKVVGLRGLLPLIDDYMHRQDLRRQKFAETTMEKWD